MRRTKRRNESNELIYWLCCSGVAIAGVAAVMLLTQQQSQSINEAQRNADRATREIQGILRAQADYVDESEKAGTDMRRQSQAIRNLVNRLETQTE